MPIIAQFVPEREETIIIGDAKAGWRHNRNQNRSNPTQRGGWCVVDPFGSLSVMRTFCLFVFIPFAISLLVSLTELQ